MKYKICILTTVHPLFDTRIFHKQAKTLAKAGYDVTLIAQHDKNEVVDGIKIIALPKPKNRFGRIFGLTWWAFRLALRQRANIYHFHDPELVLVGAFLKIFTRSNVIYDVHENVPKQIMNKFWLPAMLRRPMSCAYRVVERVSLCFIDKVIIAEDSYSENYEGRSNVLPIRNYAFLSGIETQSSLQPLHESSGNAVVIYVGGVSVLRGALQLVEAFRILKEGALDSPRLELVGPVTPPGFDGILKDLLQRYRLQNIVGVPGPVPHQHVRQLLARANVGVAILHPDPNYVESLPTKLFEYMAAGLPVIASDFPLWKEIVEGNNCGLCVNPLDPEAIADAIEYLLDHREEATRMGENGRRAVEEKYNWETEGQKLLDLYEDLSGSLGS